MPSTNATTVLSDVIDLTFELYLNEYLETSHRFSGRNTNRLFSPSDTPVGSDGINVKLETARTDTIRPSRDPLSSIPTPGAPTAAELKIRFAEGDPTNNDFMRLAGAGQVSHLEVTKAAMAGDSARRGAIADLADRTFKQISEDYEDKLAALRHVGKSGQLALVNGNIVQNDSNVYADCTGTGFSTSARIKVDGGSVAVFQDGRTFDIYKSAGTDPIMATVTDYNPADSSVGFTVHADSGANFGSTANAYDNGAIYFSGAKDDGMYSLGEWFTKPGSSDSFIGGKDRLSTSWRHLIPTTYEAGSSSAAVTIKRSHFNSLSESMQFVREEEETVAILTGLRLHNSLRDELGEDSLIFDKPMQSEKYNFGSRSIGYVHPAFNGRVDIMADALAPEDRVRFLVLDDWESFHYGHKGLEFLPGEIAGHWYRLSEANASEGRSLFYKCDAVAMGVVDYCKNPRRQGQILYVKP